MANAGRMYERVEFLKREVATNSDFGGEEETWIPKFDVWAERSRLSMQERFLSDGLKTVRLEEFIVRYRKDIDETMRLKFEGKVYKILGIIEAGTRNELMRITTEYLPELNG